MKSWPTDTSKLWLDDIWHLDTETNTDTDNKEETMPKTIVTTTPTLKASENVKLNPPKPFTGKRSDFILFMQDVYVYLKVNQLIYDDDKKKISFILSYLADKDAAVWKQQFIQMKIKESEEVKTDKPNWGRTRSLWMPSRRRSNHMMNQPRPSRT
jgi:hypothetical protein